MQPTPWEVYFFIQINEWFLMQHTCAKDHSPCLSCQPKITWPVGAHVVPAQFAVCWGRVKAYSSNAQTELDLKKMI